jgi:predicted RNA-binding protein with PUA-like domain
MKPGDQALFDHSACDEPGIVGIMKVAGKAYPDPTAFDPKDKHFDPKSDPDDPRWFLVDVKFVRKLKRTIALAELKQHDAIADMVLLRRGNRLSIMPVSKNDWDYILDLE